MPTAIRKAVISAFGDESNISVVDAEIPDPPAKHVQVRVIYSGFSGADLNMRLGIYPLQQKAPLTPGYCLVGTAETNGQGSSKFQQGDLVACLTVYDAEAQLANLPEKYLVPVPAGLDLQAVTALVLDWNTAYAMVMRSAKVSKGQKVFVHGLSGAVGLALTKLCQMQGAQVYGTASQQNHAALKARGATPFVYSNKDWIAAMIGTGGVDVVFDALGFESWDESYRILSGHGVLVGYGGNLQTVNGRKPRSMIPPTVKLFAQNLKVWSGKRTTFYYITRDDSTFESDLVKLFGLLQRGEIAVEIKRCFALEDIQDVHRNWNKGGGIGSTVIKVASEPM